MDLDSKRAMQIMHSPDSIQVLYEGSPVWIENVMGNNTAEITHFENNKKEAVPVYMLVENKPL